MKDKEKDQDPLKAVIGKTKRVIQKIRKAKCCFD